VNVFASPLDVEKIGGKNWLVKSDILIDVDLGRDGVHQWTIRKGYTFDLGSVPKRLQGIVNPGTCSRKSFVAYLVHDASYDTHMVTRRLADEVMLKTLEDSLQDPWDHWLAWAAVRLFGAGPWRKSQMHLIDMAKRIQFRWAHGGRGLAHITD
jgi:hypothetical protein